MLPRDVSAARIAGALTTTLVLLAPPAHGHQSTPGCNSNGLVHTLTEDKTAVRNGETITYAVAVANLGTDAIPACDLSNVAVSVTLPGLDGQPSGEAVVVAQGLPLPAGSPLTVVGTLAHTVEVNPGVTHLVVKGDVSATLHDAVVDDLVTGHKTLSASVTHPFTTLTVRPSVPAGAAPLEVTFTYTETNASATGTPLANRGDHRRPVRPRHPGRAAIPTATPCSTPARRGRTREPAGSRPRGRSPAR